MLTSDGCFIVSKACFVLSGCYLYALSDVSETQKVDFWALDASRDIQNPENKLVSLGQSEVTKESQVRKHDSDAIDTTFIFCYSDIR